MFDLGVEFFIGEVKRHPVLWDTTHIDFNNRHSKLTAWVDVATKMYDESETWSNYDKFGKVRELQKRWKNFRDSYMREVKYRNRVEKGLAQPKKKRYIYADLLTFLTPGAKLKSQSSSDQSSSEEESNAEMDHNDATLEDDRKDIRVEAINVEVDQNNTSGKTESNKQTSYLEEYLKQQQYSFQDASEQNASSRYHSSGDQCPMFSSTGEQTEFDDDKMFLLSLLPYFKKLDHPKKLQARISVTKLVHDFLYKTS